MDNLDEYRNPRLYDLENPDFEPEGLFYLDMARELGGPVLELGCGTGRILIPIAQEGIPIVGIDRSVDMLGRAKQKVLALAPKTRRGIKLVRGDMRDFDLGREFKLIMIPFRAFLHLLTPEDQRQKSLRMSLRPSGTKI